MRDQTGSPLFPKDGSESPPLVLVPLQSFRLRHGPQDNTKDNKNGFVGRDELIHKLVKVLENTRDSRGSYLIAGYRGVGKTSVMERVLSEYKKHDDYVPSYKHLKNYQEFSNALNQEHNESIFKSYSLRFITRGQSFIRTLKGFYSTSKKRILFIVTTAVIISCGVLTLKYSNNPFLSDGNAFQLSLPIYLLLIWATTFSLLLLHVRPNNIIDVKINLGHDEVLNTRMVLFNIIALLKIEIGKRIYEDFRPVILNLFNCIIIAALSIYVLPDILYLITGNELLTDLNMQTTGSIDNALEHVDLTIIVWSLLWFYVVYLIFFHFPYRKTILGEITHLYNRVAHSMEQSSGVNSRFLSLGFKKVLEPLQEPQIEIELLNLLDRCRKYDLDLIFVFDELDKISVNSGTNFGEDSIRYKEGRISQQGNERSVTEQIKERKKRVDYLLGGLKNLITVGKARFFFIAGRDMLDAYQAEKGRTNALYESLFGHFFEVPSLLTDESDSDISRLASMIEVYVCRRLMPEPVALLFWSAYHYAKEREDKCNEEDYDIEKFFKKYILRKDINLNYLPYRLSTYYHFLIHSGVQERDAQLVIHTLRNFINYLTLHSWGNCKRLTTLFDGFTRRQGITERLTNYVDAIPGLESGSEVQYMLYFGLLENQRITFGANIFVMFNHHMSRQLGHADKLLVTTMAALHYTIKFHRSGFSRHHLYRMTEMMSIYSSPELNSAVDTAISLVLKPYIRRIRNGIYRYRFYSDAEQEIRYISRISDLESASFNFSLDSIENIKAH